MGSSTVSDVVPFVAHDVIYIPSQRSPETEFEQIFCSPFSYQEGEYCDNPKEVVLNDWSYQPENLTNVGKKDKLYGDIWTKNEYVVWVVNESEYESVGEYVMSVVANDQEAIEVFMADFQFSQDIEETDSVQQTL